MTAGKKITQNPFVYFEPVQGDDFSNREAIVNEIVKKTLLDKSQANIWITGERQVGKTSLLQQIEKLHRGDNPTVTLYGTNQEFKVRFVYFNCQLIRDESDFYKNITQCLANHFPGKLDDMENPYDNFINWLKALRMKHYYIIFLFDEFDAFISKFARRSPENTSHFLDTFNVIKQELPYQKGRQRAFGVICASNCTIGELTEDLGVAGSGLVFFQELDLSHFDEKQVSHLANQYLENNQVQFTGDEIRFCFKMTHGYPLFTQNLFYIMYEEKKKAPGAPDKNYLKNVKKEYGKAFEKIVVSWKKQKTLTHRTLGKVRGLAKSLKEEFTDLSSTVISEILKKQIDG